MCACVRVQFNSDHSQHSPDTLLLSVLQRLFSFPLFLSECSWSSFPSIQQSNKELQWVSSPQQLVAADDLRGECEDNPLFNPKMISIKRLKSPQNSVSYQAVHFNMGCPGDWLAFGASSGRLRNWNYFCVGLIFQTRRSPQTQLIAFCCIMGFIRSVGPGARPVSGRKSGCLRDLLRHFSTVLFFFWSWKSLLFMRVQHWNTTLSSQICFSSFCNYFFFKALI